MKVSSSRGAPIHQKGRNDSMANRKFENGAKVRHKSGGPVMIVADFAVYGLGETVEKYLCRWFDGKQMKDDTFIEAEIESFEPVSNAAILQRG
jgi:uncharacterized protein YodC (DUF2158 family)